MVSNPFFVVTGASAASRSRMFFFFFRLICVSVNTRAAACLCLCYRRGDNNQKYTGSAGLNYSENVGRAVGGWRRMDG